MKLTKEEIAQLEAAASMAQSEGVDDDYGTSTIDIVNRVVAALSVDAVPTIFRVNRQIVDGHTVGITLTPYSGAQHIDLAEGDEFLTGTLSTDIQGLLS
jgi:hypothetical protein